MPSSSATPGTGRGMVVVVVVVMSTVGSGRGGNLRGTADCRLRGRARWATGQVGTVISSRMGWWPCRPPGKTARMLRSIRRKYPKCYEQMIQECQGAVFGREKSNLDCFIESFFLDFLMCSSSLCYTHNTLVRDQPPSPDRTLHKVHWHSHLARLRVHAAVLNSKQAILPNRPCLLPRGRASLPPVPPSLLLLVYRSSRRIRCTQ